MNNTQHSKSSVIVTTIIYLPTFIARKRKVCSMRNILKHTKNMSMEIFQISSKRLQLYGSAVPFFYKSSNFTYFDTFYYNAIAQERVNRFKHYVKCLYSPVAQ